MDVANTLKLYIFNSPAILLGLVALISLIAQRKKTDQIITGTVKTVIGFLIMFLGANIITNTVLPISDLLNMIMNVEASSISVMGQGAFITKYGSIIIIIMVLSFFINVALARVTRFKYIYLTVHQMFWMIFVYVAVAIEAIPGISNIALIVAGSVAAGLYFTLQPAIMQPFTRKVTGNNDIAFGHITSFGGIVSSLAGNLFKKDKDKSSETINIPDKIRFLKDLTVSTALVMLVLHILCVVIAGPGNVQESISGGVPGIYWAVIQSLQFTVGITIILVGIGMMVAEITPAFKGFADKIVPDAIPAFDCPVFFNFAPTAVMIGFLSCLVTVIICVVVFASVGFFALTPPVITTFYGGATCGVFGNSTGGWKGALLGGVIGGLLISFGQALTVTALSNTVADFARWSNDFDYSVFPYFVKQLLSLFG